MLNRRKVAALLVGAGLSLSACSTGSLSTSGTETSVSGQRVGIEGTQDQMVDVTQFCGTKDLTVAYADGFGGNSWRKITRKLFEMEAAKCPNIKKVLYTDAQNDTQKAISDINSLVAQKVDVIVTWPDSGEALLPTIKKATQAGVKVVPIIGSVGGTPGKDYVDFVSEDITAYGSSLAEWTIKAMGGKGNLVMLGGTAGNAYSQAVLDGVAKVAKDHPDVTLINPDTPVVTDWEPGKTQQVVAGLITKYGSIDGIVADYGGGSVGGIRAFLAAGQPIPPWSANDSNEFACLWHQYKDSEPKYQIATESSRNWVVVAALHKGLAAANGMLNEEPSKFQLQIIEDSTNASLAPKCEPTLPPDAIISSGLSIEQMKELFK